MQRYVVVADASRARIFSYEFSYDPDGPHERLHEEFDLVDLGHQRHESFVGEVVGKLSEISRSHGPRDLIIVASAQILGELRKQLDDVAKSGIVVDEVDRDLTKFTSNELRGRLAELGLLAPRLTPATISC